MTAYFRSSIGQYLAIPDESVSDRLNRAYSKDGYVTQYTSAIVAWGGTLIALRRELKKLLQISPGAENWQVLLEYPLYRLRRRIDAVIISPRLVFVLELKTGATGFSSQDRRQAEEYAQDLRDFHSASKTLRLRPVLWSFNAEPQNLDLSIDAEVGVGRLRLVGHSGLAETLAQDGVESFASDDIAEAYGRNWDGAPYEPVPSVIEAAVTMFSGHGVREITLAGAKNLDEAAEAAFVIINQARLQSLHAVVFLTGVPGAGKTLAGLNIVHDAVERGLSTKGDVVYLSGNTPLVVVLREALALDQCKRPSPQGQARKLTDIRKDTRATIQHINDFLKAYVHGAVLAPSGHVIVFDEAQRAWDARQGKEKFNRDASEPMLVLEAMARHPDWSVTICLVGLGQEINDGEEGIAGWAEAIDKISAASPAKWRVFGPQFILGGTRSHQALGDFGPDVAVVGNESLHLDVPMRSFRSPELGAWIDCLLRGSIEQAAEVAGRMSYKIWVTRSLPSARTWLKDVTRGERRMGLLASSGAKRLRADGIGQVLRATDGAAISHWYLEPREDIRSSFALEVPANEYTSQGLELDFACLCWGGDLIVRGDSWMPRSLAGNQWNEVRSESRARFVLNSYRVLLSRAREGLVVWIPQGDCHDHTRRPEEFDAVARLMLRAGCLELS